ncbi:MAG: hypothetical protein OQJ89_09435, partial [Kangiellaceae bacterium]|nr:hypothetical protein [Kangiellaceae bacterium]
MRNFLFIAIILFILFSTNIAANSELRVHQIPHESLPSEFIADVVELSNGYLLFSTQTGARLFDGTNFLRLLPKGTSTISPLDTYVYASLEDKSKNIWLATGVGLYILTSNGTQLLSFEEFIAAQNNKASPGPPRSSSLLGPRNRKVSTNVREIIEDSDGNIWFGTLDGLGKYSPASGKVEYLNFQSSGPDTESSLGRVYVVHQHRDTVWIGSSKGLFYLSHDAKNIQRYPGKIGSSYITSAISYSPQEIWFGTDVDGLFKLNVDTKAIENVHTNNSKELSLKSNNIWALFKDKEGMVWLGYWAKGITVWDTKRHKQYNIDYRLNDKVTLPSPSIEKIYSDSNGLIWIATSGGAAFFNPENFKLQSTHHIPGDNNSINRSNVISVFEYSEDEIWLGTEEGLELWDPLSGKITHFYDLDPSAKNQNKIAVWRIQSHASDHLILATERGLIYFDKRDGTTTKIDGLKDFSGNPVNVSFYTITRDGVDSFLAASSSATIHLITPSTGEHQLIYDASQNKKTAETEYYLDIERLDENRLWLASTTGIHLVDYKNNKVEVYSATQLKNHISSNMINSLAFSQNQLWAATQSGGINIID